MSRRQIAFAVSPAKILVLFVLSSLFVGCGEGRQTMSHTEQLTQSAKADGVNILSLASSDSANLQTPWNAQDKNLIQTINLRSPNLSPDARLVTETSFPCSGGGTITRTVDNQGPPWFSQGDTYTTTFTDCVQGNTQTNGVRTFSVDTLVGQPFIDPTWNMSTTMSRQNFVKLDLTTDLSSSADGSVTTSVDATQDANNPNWYSYVQTTTGNWNRTHPNNGTDVTSSGSVNVTFSFSDDPASRYSWDFDVMADSSQFGSTAAKTLTTLEGNNNMPPDTGKLSITKVDTAGQTTITYVTAQADGQVLVEVDVAGDGTIDSTNTTTWSQLVLEPLIFQFF